MNKEDIEPVVSRTQCMLYAESPKDPLRCRLAARIREVGAFAHRQWGMRCKVKCAKTGRGMSAILYILNGFSAATSTLQRSLVRSYERIDGGLAELILLEDHITVRGRSPGPWEVIHW